MWPQKVLRYVICGVTPPPPPHGKLQLLDSKVKFKVNIVFKMPRLSNVSKENAERLICLVQAQPHLYDMSSKEYKDAIMIANTWKYIAKSLDLEGMSILFYIASTVFWCL